MLHKRSRLAVLASLPLLVSSLLPVGATAAAPVRVILDGRVLQLDPAPTIVDGRTLVPLRGVFEAMGATPIWNGEDRSVEVVRSWQYLRLRIDRRLACLSRDCTNAAVLDVPAQIVSDRTYVPIRFVAQAMGANVAWDDSQRAVVINTSKSAENTASPLTIPSVKPGQVISGPINLQTTGVPGTSVQFLLLDPATGSGPIVAAGSDVGGSYTYTPEPTVSGARLLVAAVRDAAGKVTYSDPVSVRLAPDPTVQVTGLQPNGEVDGPISFGSAANFVAARVAFKLIAPDNSTEDLGTAGPGDQITWYPQVGQNGPKSIQAVAYDRAGKAYPSVPVPVQVNSGYRTVFSGVSAGDVLAGPVTFRVAGNYPIESVKYILDGVVFGWGFNKAWNITPDNNGPHTLSVEIGGKDGVVRTVGPVNFTVNAKPQVWLHGVGPDQVVTGPLDLSVTSNVPLSTIEYWVKQGNGQMLPVGGSKPDGSFHWTPNAAGNYTVEGVIVTAAGQSLYTDPVSFRVYLGTVYGPKPLTSKDEFKGLATQLAIANYRETGIAASLQVAQALLETGWGQSVPVDKYTGQFSYNLFGMKGTGPAGSIISNTWEEYNGLTYRVDANFRAYHNVAENWRDHSDLLLTRAWYAPFRAVMSNPVLGAWGLKRSGYATDSQYPTKLINIMNQYDLFKLDNIEL
ncbi:MAG: stalk domain-containing protein [Mycobacterium leprae]